MAEHKERPPGFWVYTTLLGLISLLLSVVGYLSIAKFDTVEKVIERVATATDANGKELSSLKATIESWRTQNFVPRDLFDALKSETERRIAALETRPK